MTTREAALLLLDGGTCVASRGRVFTHRPGYYWGEWSFETSEWCVGPHRLPYGEYTRVKDPALCRRVER